MDTEICEGQGYVPCYICEAQLPEGDTNARQNSYRVDNPDSANSVIQMFELFGLYAEIREVDKGSFKGTWVQIGACSTHAKNHSELEQLTTKEDGKINPSLISKSLNV